MKDSIRQKLALLTDRLGEIDLLLSAPETAGDMDQFRRLTRERSEVEPVVLNYQAFCRCEQDLAAAEGLRGDPEMRDFAEEEIAACKARLPALWTGA